MILKLFQNFNTIIYKIFKWNCYLAGVYICWAGEYIVVIVALLLCGGRDMGGIAIPDTGQLFTLYIWEFAWLFTGIWLVKLGFLWVESETFWLPGNDWFCEGGGTLKNLVELDESIWFDLSNELETTFDGELRISWFLLTDWAGGGGLI